MTIRNLEHLFRPGSIALIGASRKPRSVGAVLARNLFAGGFAGPILPVHPEAEAIEGVLAYKDVAALPVAPDLAVIATPPATVPGLVAQLAARGTHAAIVITAGFGEGGDEAGARLRQAMLDAAKPTTFRIVGPNCIGIAVPGSGLDATFAHVAPLPGSIACLTQSGAVATALLDWAAAREIGFSCMVSLGDMADVDFGDMLDWLAGDADTRSIILYIEGIGDARKFMSAARRAARVKPVVVIKAGRHREAAKAAGSHTGALTGADTVYDAAFRRAGMLRVTDLEELFAAVETLARMRPMDGDRLAVVTNGGGVGVITTDDLLDAGARLAALDSKTIDALDKVLPRTWSRGNPIDIIGDATPERYAKTLETVLEDRNADAVLVLNVPTAIASALDAADAVIASCRTRNRNLLTCWLGDHQAIEARRRFAGAGIPSFATPGEAVRGFMHMARFRRNQRTLVEAPASAAAPERPPDRAAASAIVERALAERREWLDAAEAKAVLAAYGVRVVETRAADTPDEVRRVAAALGGPVAVKIRSRDVTHKSDVGGVALNLATPDDAAAAARAMIERVRALKPEARVDGVTVQRMVHRPGAFELIVGIGMDPTFGPVVLFGQGGVGVEAIGDSSVDLAPLNPTLARELIGRTRIARQLRGYRNRPPADLDGIVDTLVRVSRLAGELPAVAELDINPLLADETGVLALDARIRVQAPARAVRLAILPYPSELERRARLPDGTELFIRPVRPEDAGVIQRGFARLRPQDIHFRFFSMMKQLAPEQVARFTQIDYDREMALLAFPAGSDEMAGVGRLIADPDMTRAEFSVLIEPEWQGHGLGHLLMEAILDHARQRGIDVVHGTVLAENARMLELAHALGFTETRDPSDYAVVRVEKRLF